MEKADVLTLVAGILIVLVIAVIANPSYLNILKGAVEKSPPTPALTQLPVPAVIYTIMEPPTSVKPTLIPVIPDAPPYQILYSDKPFSYPVFKIPENMETFGASDIISQKQEMVPFAFVDGKGGGLTQIFSVPYPVWVINTTVIANTTPQYGKFQMALCNAKDGTIIEGEEIMNKGTSYRSIQVSNTDMYMIISTAYIDGYHISLEAPRNYYDVYRPR